MKTLLIWYSNIDPENFLRPVGEKKKRLTLNDALSMTLSFSLSGLQSTADAAKAAADTLYSGIGFLEEEQKAQQLMKFVRTPDVQEKVKQSFVDLYKVRTSINDECEKNVSLCATLHQPSETSSSVATACVGQENFKLFSVPTDPVYNDFDAVTLVTRWTKLKTARRLYEELRKQTTSINDYAVKVDLQKKLDAAIHDYQSVPSTRNVADGMVLGWIRLTTVACDEGDNDEIISGLVEFAEKSKTVYKKAKDAADKARGNSSTSATD